MRSNICDVDTLLRNCQYVKRTIAFSTLSFIRSGSDSVWTDDLEVFFMGPSAFFSQLQFSLLSTWDNADCILNAGWLSYHDSILEKTFHAQCGLLHPANSFFFFFPHKHVSLRATVLLVFPLLKTTESGCLRSTDPALCLRGISTQYLYNFFFFFFGTFNFAKQPFAMHNCCGPERNVVLQGNITQMLTTSRCWAILTRGEKTPHVSALVQSKAWSALGKFFFSIALRDLGWSSRQLRLPGSLKVLTLTGVVYALLVRLVILYFYVAWYWLVRNVL